MENEAIIKDYLENGFVTIVAVYGECFMKKKLILGCAILLITPLPLLHAEEGLEENVYYNSSYTIGGTSSIGAGND